MTKTLNKEKRKGARTLKDVTPKVLTGLNSGQLETASLPEALSVNFVKLAHAVGLGHIDMPPDLGIVKRMEFMGERLASQPKIYKKLKSHASDTVRGWVCYAIARNSSLTLDLQMQQLLPLVQDAHFSVREWVWMAIRPQVSLQLQAAIKILKPWVRSPDPAVRRFVTEVTRPRGVWCAHITALKEAPSIGLPLLNPLHRDPERYVQNSVANWLNDASKHDPKWVMSLTADWLKKAKGKSHEKFTSYIVRRARRTMVMLSCLLLGGLHTAQASSFYISAGSFFQNMISTTSSPDASMSILGQIYVPQVGVMGSIGFLPMTSLMPTVNYSVSAKKGGNGVKKTILIASLPLAIQSVPGFDFKFGPGLMLYSVGSSGGAVQLNNGTSTATFYLPDGTKTSKVLFVDLGVGVALSNDFRLDLDLILPALLSSRRALNLSAMISYGLF